MVWEITTVRGLHTTGSRCVRGFVWEHRGGADPAPDQGRWDFLVAHAGPDAQVAARVSSLLEAGGATVFLDAAELRPGVVWPQVLAQAQRRSTVTVILVSKHTAAAYYQLEELAEASSPLDSGHDPFVRRQDAVQVGLVPPDRCP